MNSETSILIIFKNRASEPSQTIVSQILYFLQTQEIIRLNGIYKRMLNNAGVTLIEGEGKLVSPHVVEVTQPDGSKHLYKAKNILIATGSRAQLVNIPGKV